MFAIQCYIVLFNEPTSGITLQKLKNISTHAICIISLMPHAVDIIDFNQ
jgi:hypothetical protein